MEYFSLEIFNNEFFFPEYISLRMLDFGLNIVEKQL